MLVAIVTFRGRCRIPEITKTKFLVTIVNGFHFITLPKTKWSHPRCGTDPRSILGFCNDICNGKVIFVTK